ncbi:hypothetical protein [Kitasatospora sp. NPDC088779]|uniref:hypothetical protein n=1 Tax=Kitasatospora sp. NPDC088779 TaxID=3154964 RepID=UPI00341EFB4B
MFALVGVCLGAVATHLAELRRARWEERRWTRELRVRVYGEFLTALEETAQALLKVLRALPPGERGEAVQEAFTAHGLGAVRQRLHVVAPADVVLAADAVFRELSRSRDMADGFDALDMAALDEAKDRAGDLRDRLQQLMSEDIGR